MITRIHIYIHIHDAVTTIRSMQSVYIRSRLSQHTSVEINAFTFANPFVQTGDRRGVQQNLIHGKALLYIQTSNIRTSDTNGIIRTMTAHERGVGFQLVTHDCEERVIIVTITAHQFIYKRKIHIIVNRGECSDVGVFGHIFIEEIAIQHQVRRGNVEINHGIRTILESLFIAHIVGGDRHESVKSSVVKCVGEGTVRINTA